MFRRGCLVQCRGNYSWELLVGNCQLMSGSSAEGSALDAGPEVEGTVSVASTDNPTIRRNRAHLDFVNKLIVSGYENNRSSDSFPNAKALLSANLNAPLNLQKRATNQNPTGMIANPCGMLPNKTRKRSHHASCLHASTKDLQQNNLHQKRNLRF